MSYPTIYAGARAPEGLEVHVSTRAGTQALDPTAVQSVELWVYRRKVTVEEETCPGQHLRFEAVPMGQLTEVPQVWASTITSRGCGKVIVSHEFQDGDDVDTPGFLVVCPRLTTTQGVLRAEPVDVQVLPLV